MKQQNAKDLYKAGEVVKFEFSVESCIKDDTIIITSATWFLRNVNTKEVIEQGTAYFEGVKGYCIVPFAVSGSYNLEVWVSVPPETMYSEIYVEVEE